MNNNQAIKNIQIGMYTPIAKLKGIANLLNGNPAASKNNIMPDGNNAVCLLLNEIADEIKTLADKLTP